MLHSYPDDHTVPCFNSNEAEHIETWSPREVTPDIVRVVSTYRLRRAGRHFVRTHCDAISMQAAVGLSPRVLDLISCRVKRDEIIPVARSWLTMGGRKYLNNRALSDPR